MFGTFKKLSMLPKGLRYKLMIAFSLMSIIPLLVCVYLVNIYIFPHLDNLTEVSITVIFSIAIALLGLGLAKRLVDPVIEMAIEARVIANGEYDKRIAIVRDDEIGQIGESINVMTQRIRSNLDELKSYGQRTREINIEIHKKVLALSSLLQIGDIISTSSMDLKTTLELAAQKASAIFDSGFGVLYLTKVEAGEFIAETSYNVDNDKLQDMVVRIGHGIIGKALEEHAVAIVDEAVKKSSEVEAFRTAYNVKNCLAIPLFSGKNNVGIFLVGNNIDGFKFKSDDIDLVKVFAKQMTIAIENDTLLKKTEELAIKDDLTDLYNKNYIMTRLEEEIKRAIFYQRPCSFLIFNIDNFRDFREKKGELAAEEVIKKMAKLIKEHTDPTAKAARVSGDEFAMLLPEKNKKEATRIAEEVRKKIESTHFVRESKEMLTVSAGVSENPIDGTTYDELFKKAMAALRRAKTSGKNKVAI